MEQKILTRSVSDECRHPWNLTTAIAIHPAIGSGRIIINYPGFAGDIDGYNNKYRTLAEFMAQKIGSVVRMSNQYRVGLDYHATVQEDLRAVILYALENSMSICGTEDPDIYLMGFSAGASAVSAVAYEFKQVKKILLVSPSLDAGEISMRKGLAEFTGEVYIVAGENDNFVGSQVAEWVFSKIKKASIRKLVMIPDCDHQFRGAKNGIIMSKSPLWAFLGDQSFPSVEGGIRLY